MSAPAVPVPTAALLPRLIGAELVAGPPQPRPGAWAGAPSAVLVGSDVHLAYRVRLPIGHGRGIANVVAASADGVHFDTVATVERDRFGADSLERPALTVTPEGRWRLYVSCATPGTKHWRVELLEADTPAGLATAPARTVLPGSPERAVKDPVVLHDGDRWHLWASVHPLERWDDADRMWTEHATSADGVAWTWQGTALAGRPDAWDARGARITSVLDVGDGVVATYDGRASAAQNWEELTGLAHGSRTSDGGFGAFTAVDAAPLASPHAAGGLRYVSVVPLGDGRVRLYYEITRADGSHELRTELAD